MSFRTVICGILINCSLLRALRFGQRAHSQTVNYSTPNSHPIVHAELRADDLLNRSGNDACPRCSGSCSGACLHRRDSDHDSPFPRILPGILVSFSRRVPRRINRAFPLRVPYSTSLDFLFYSGLHSGPARIQISARLRCGILPWVRFLVSFISLSTSLFALHLCMSLD
jgi:hypothetical protein